MTTPAVDLFNTAETSMAQASFKLRNNLQSNRSYEEDPLRSGSTRCAWRLHSRWVVGMQMRNLEIACECAPSRRGSAHLLKCMKFSGNPQATSEVWGNSHGDVSRWVAGVRMRNLKSACKCAQSWRGSTMLLA